MEVDTRRGLGFAACSAGPATEGSPDRRLQAAGLGHGE